jgi:hypothetical protein
VLVKHAAGESFDVDCCSVNVDFFSCFRSDANLINRGPNIYKSLKRLSLDPLKTSCLAGAAGTLTRSRASAPAANPRAASTFPAIARSPCTSSAGRNSISSIAGSVSLVGFGFP